METWLTTEMITKTCQKYSKDLQSFIRSSWQFQALLKVNVIWIELKGNNDFTGFESTDSHIFSLTLGPGSSLTKIIRQIVFGSSERSQPKLLLKWNQKW